MSNLGGIDEAVEKDQEVEEADKVVEMKKRKLFHYWTVGGTEYKLKLNTAMIEKLENKYRTNILNLVTQDDVPALSVMLTVIQGAMVPWHHGISYNDVKKMYDKWTEDGGNQMQFFTGIVMPTLAVSGFFTDKQAELMMESLEDLDSDL